MIILAEKMVYWFQDHKADMYIGMILCVIAIILIVYCMFKNNEDNEEESYDK